MVILLFVADRKFARQSFERIEWLNYCNLRTLQAEVDDHTNEQYYNLLQTSVFIMVSSNCLLKMNLM